MTVGLSTSYTSGSEVESSANDESATRSTKLKFMMCTLELVKSAEVIQSDMRGHSPSMSLSSNPSSSYSKYSSSSDDIALGPFVFSGSIFLRLCSGDGVAICAASESLDSGGERLIQDTGGDGAGVESCRVARSKVSVRETG